MHSNKPKKYDKKVNPLEKNKKSKVNNVDNNYKAWTYNKKTTDRNNKPQRKFIELTYTTDNIFNVFLKEELIDIPLIVEPKFCNDVPKNFYLRNFAIITGYLNI